MRLLKKTILKASLFSLIFGMILQMNSALAVSDEVIEIHDKTQKLASLVTDYYVKEHPEGLYGLRNFIEKLNETQLKIFKDSFNYWGFPQLVHNGSEVSLTVSVRSINLLVAAVKSADLEFVKLVVENFDIPDMNETDDCGSGSPLWCAVCLAGRKGVDDETVKGIVDYLLSVGANPYSNSGKGYIPHLFDNSRSSVPRMILKEVFEKYGYNDICNNKDEFDFSVSEC